MEIYPAKYTDKNGEFETTIRNDGKTLRMNVRDVEFYGHSFDTFEIENGISEDRLALFSLSKTKDICNCTIECEIPIKVIADEIDLDARLFIKLELGRVTEKGWVEKEDVFLKLKYQDFELDSQGKSGWFEDELLDIQKQLPIGHKLKNCFGCAFSDYSVYGHGLFGGMFCFRNIKDEYIKILDKKAFMNIMHNAEEKVQETYLCPEFEIRKANTGYRG